MLQLIRVNESCSVQLLEEGPVLLKSLGPVSTHLVSHCVTVYTCTGMTVTDKLQAMCNSGFLGYFTNADQTTLGEQISLSSNEQNNWDNFKAAHMRPENSRGIKRKRESEESINTADCSIQQDGHDSGSGIVSEISPLSSSYGGQSAGTARHSSWILFRGSPDFVSLADPWKKKTKHYSSKCPKVAPNRSVQQTTETIPIPCQDTVSSAETISSSIGSNQHQLTDQWLSNEMGGVSESFENMNISLAKAGMVMVSNMCGLCLERVWLLETIKL